MCKIEHKELPTFIVTRLQHNGFVLGAVFFHDFSCFSIWHIVYYTLYCFSIVLHGHCVQSLYALSFCKGAVAFTLTCLFFPIPSWLHFNLLKERLHVIIQFATQSVLLINVFFVTLSPVSIQGINKCCFSTKNFGNVFLWWCIRRQPAMNEGSDHW